VIARRACDGLVVDPCAHAASQFLFHPFPLVPYCLQLVDDRTSLIAALVLWKRHQKANHIPVFQGLGLALGYTLPIDRHAIGAGVQQLHVACFQGEGAMQAGHAPILPPAALGKVTTPTNTQRLVWV